ncbi:MAG TPA: hypothetical protein PLS49_01640 [Candidatus Woesebacteria bacterium]|nr:hypothetical protein [Candidatus Woesebacteria bacterium]
MKVFLVSTPIGETEHGQLFKKLYEEIKKLGYIHTSNLITQTSDEFLTKMKEGKQAHKEFYKSMIDGINNADICVFEASTPSFGVGYLIQSSLNSSKPTIVLFYKEVRSNLLPGIDDEKLVYHTYDETNYKKIIKKSLDEAREKRDKRFNFFLSPKLLNYLEKVSNTQGVTKSKILRDLIVEHMRKNNTVVEE